MTKHKPVLVAEVLDYLEPKTNQNFVDCTVGGGGHAEKILEATSPDGKLLGLDWDPSAIKRTAERLKPYKKRLVLVNQSYTELKDVVYDKKFTKINGILLDLGLSSDQLQDSGRGFSFQTNEPLDMRFNPEENTLTAAEIVNEWPIDRITDILQRFGEERWARRIAEHIGQERKNTSINKTLDLVKIIMDVYPQNRKSRIHPATKTFQALRIAVNNELENVKNILDQAVELLEKNGRLAVITFHSLEDRIVKDYFKIESKDCICPKDIPECRCGHQSKIKILTKKPVGPSAKEIEDNWRSRSAKLRVVEKIV